MAPVQQHTSSSPPAAPHTLAAINWPFASPPPNETAGKYIEIRGSTYLAYCKAWAPLWVDPDEEEDLGV